MEPANVARPKTANGIVVPCHADSYATVASQTIGGNRAIPIAKIKAKAEWQESLWTRWSSESEWPVKLDIYEAAAYLRVSPDTIRRHLAVARDGKARLAHQRVGSVYRIRRVDLDALGSVAGRL